MRLLSTMSVTVCRLLRRCCWGLFPTLHLVGCIYFPRYSIFYVTLQFGCRLNVGLSVTICHLHFFGTCLSVNCFMICFGCLSSVRFSTFLQGIGYVSSIMFQLVAFHRYNSILSVEFCRLHFVGYILSATFLQYLKL